MENTMEKVAQLEAKLAMSELIRNSENKKAKENLNRIGSEIRTYYLDVMNAKDEPMTLELGECLLDEIMDVFNILMKYGIKLN